MIAESVTLGGDSRLYARLWLRGDGSERGVVILLHGLGDHGGRYECFARRMTKRGLAVFAIDLPGHGRSAGRRGSVRSYDGILRLVATARNQMSERLGDIDQILLGHSMGGNLAVNYALRCQEFETTGTRPLSALVLVAPMLMPPLFLDRQKVMAAWGTGQLLRWIRVSKPASVDQLTRDAKVAELIREDPLQHSQVSLYLATQLLAQGRFALDHAASIEMPTLVIQGDEDQLVDQAASRNLVLRMRDRARFVHWLGGRHDLINDLDAEAVSDHLSRWIKQTRGSASGSKLDSIPIVFHRRFERSIAA